jgi:hypothetical protein
MGVAYLSGTTSGGNGGNGGGDAYTVLLIHSDSVTGSQVFTDSSSGGSESPHAITATSDAQHDESVSKFGASGVSLAGTDDSLESPDSDDWDFGSGDFTVDFWIYRQQHGGQMALINNWTPGASPYDGGWGIEFDNGSYLVVYWDYGPDIKQMASSNQWQDSGGPWRHIAFVRYGNVFSTYVGGVVQSTGEFDHTIEVTAEKLHIGINKGDVNEYLGYMDEIRISKGIARWTGNFDVPTGPYE